MSSGAQVDLDWAVDAAQGGVGDSLAPKNDGLATSTNRATGAAYLTDEEILGIDLPSPNGGFGGPDVESSQRDSPVSGVRWTPPESEYRTSSALRTGPRQNDRSEDVADATAQLDGSTSAKNPGSEDPGYSKAATAGMPAWMAAAATDPQHSAEARQLWREHQEFRAAFASPEEARAVKELLPGGVRDVLSLREATQSVERIDAAIFSGDARAQAEVVAELARANPAAFRSLFAEAAKVVAGLGTRGNEARGRETGGTEARNLDGSASSNLSVNPTLRTNREGWGTPKEEAGDLRPEPGPQNGSPERDLPESRERFHQAEATNPDSRATSHPSPELRASESQTFDPTAYAAFERATNDAVARDVRGSIHDTLARVLPEGVAEGAARRIGEDIFQEVHRVLAADRSLSEQVAGVLSARRFGGAEQQRVASLLASRAKQIVPSVARRVIGEWTSTVLNTARSKAARQATATSRVDIDSSGGSRDSMPLRQMSPREVNYASMSDEQILGM